VREGSREEDKVSYLILEMGRSERLRSVDQKVWVLELMMKEWSVRIKMFCEGGLK
jgi:hypothetical protein